MCGRLAARDEPPVSLVLIEHFNELISSPTPPDRGFPLIFSITYLPLSQ